MARQRSYLVALSLKERKVIKHIQKHTNSLNLRTRCAVILAADENRSKAPKTYAQIASISGACVATVIAVLKAFAEKGFVFAMTPHRNPNSDTGNLKATGDVEAKIIATACGKVPQGYARWTLSLLSAEMTVILEEPVSRATIAGS